MQAIGTRALALGADALFGANVGAPRDPSRASDRHPRAGIGRRRLIRRIRRGGKFRIMDQFAVNTRCRGVAAYIEGYDKFDGKFNAVAMQAEERNDYWD